MNIDLGENLDPKQDLEDFGTPYLKWIHERLSFYAKATEDEIDKRVHAQMFPREEEPSIVPEPVQPGNY